MQLEAVILNVAFFFRSNLILISNLLELVPNNGFGEFRALKFQYFLKVVSSSLKMFYV